ncbi:unnamed protein product, partial [Ectocarpus fasciculatus]
ALVDRWLVFTLILIPDVFMTLETLHKSFESLLVKYPLARLVIVGPPGSPYSHWPRGWILNADIQSRSILSLMLHLKETDRVGNRSDPIFMMGFGTGAYSMSRFVSLFLPALSWMQRRLKCVVVVNGFVHISKGFKRVCKDLRSALLLANPAEVSELVSSLHFSDDFLCQNDRQQTQKLFWSTRRGLCSINQNDIAQAELQPGKQYTGILEQLRGLLIGPDTLSPAESFLSSTSIPLFVVQGTDDVFVNPTEINMSYSKKNVETANRVMVEGILEGLVPGSVHLSWLKCGHEILIERPGYLLAMISNFIQDIRSIPEDSVQSDTNCSYQDELDPVELARMRREAAAREQERIKKEKEEELQMEAAEAARIKEEQDELERQRELFQIELALDQEAERKTIEMQQRIQKEQLELLAEQQREKEDAAIKSAKREREKSSRLQAVAERKRREAKEARKAELQELYETQRLFTERKAETYETSRMSIEDQRSYDLKIYTAECEAAEASALLAQEKVQDLFSGRREDAMKKIEEKMAFQRASRLEKRRRDAEDSLKKLEKEESEEDNEGPGRAPLGAKDYSQEPLDLSREAIAACIANTHQIFKDFMACRQKLIESMKRQKLVEQKTIMFRAQRDDLETEIRKLQRALRLFVKGTLASELGATTHELEELKTNLADKENTLTEFIAIGRDKESHLDSTNRSVQQLKVAVVALEDIMSRQLKDMQTLEKHLSTRARRLKFKKENELIGRDKHITSRNMVSRRLDIVKEEYVRVKGHKEQYVDSDVLFDGVLQRCLTKTLRKHLKLERSKWEGRVEEIEKEIKDSQHNVDVVNEQQVICKLDLDKITLSIRYFFRGYNKARQQSIVEDVAEAIALQERAASTQDRRDDEQQNMSQAEMVDFIVGKPAAGLAAKTRKKPLDLRTKEDRRFIGIDLVLHPEEYLDINVTEAEEMQFDPDYQCDLKKSDLERIEKLPELIALAMPFLHSRTEVSIHRLINIYYRDRDDEYYKMKDFLSYGVVEDDNSGRNGSVTSLENSTTAVSVSQSEMSNAEVVHEVLVKESRRDRIRSMVSKQLTDDELAWLQLDKILSPHVYEITERTTVSTNRRLRNNTVLEPEVRDPHDLVSSINDRAGDRYEEIRWRFEGGEVVFEAAWTCVASRNELLKIRDTVDETRMNDHDIRCKRLMEKYYVDDDESLLGQNRLKHIQAVSCGISRHIAKEVQFAAEERVELMNRSASVMEEQALNDELAANRIWGSFECGNTGELSNSEARDLGKKSLLTLPGNDQPATVHRNDPNSKWYICESAAELAKQEYRRTRGKVVLLAESEPLVLLDIPDMTLQARQSRSHRFDIPDQDDSRVLEICVSVIFQGTFSEKGYRFGRIAAGLFRLRTESGSAGTATPPRPVGYAPYDLQAPNTPDSMGRIVLIHKPQIRPIEPGSFQIVVGCAAYSKYSVHVACVYAKTALPVIDNLLVEAKRNQARLPVCLKELDDLTVGLRLAERKLIICQQMIREMETDSNRCEVAMSAVHDLLVKDDEMMTMSEDERKVHSKELAILEVEFAQNNATYTSRCVELDYIKEGIKLMHDFKRDRQTEKQKLKESLEIARRDLPACVALLRSLPEATNVAIQLNTSLDGKLSDATLASKGAGGASEEQRVSTPADRVRRLYRSEGYNILSLEERQFLVLDKAMVPHKYEWETEQLEEENLRRQEQGKRPKKPRKYDAAVEAFRIEIERILSQPFAALSRQEMAVRKLLSKFHDNPEQVKRGMGPEAHGFDPHRAERTRIKMSKAMSQEELQWMSIDKILHPEYGDAGEQGVAVNRLGKLLGMSTEEIENEQRMAAGDLAAMLKSEDEKHALRLLLKYNGTYLAYAQTMEESRRRAANEAKLGSHIRWGAHGLVSSTDVDFRAREVLLELDKAMANKNFWMDSRVLHNENQRFPTAMVRLQLEDALDALLRGQIQERERADRIGKAGDESDDDSADDELAEREAEASSDSDLEIGSAERMLAEVKKRAARREKRRIKRKKEDLKQQVHKARKMILLVNKSGDALEQAALQNELGHSGCLACRSPMCQWKPTCDEEVLKLRVRELVAELERVRSEIDGEIFVSEVAIGAQLGGGNVYRRNDLVEELTNEQRELERRIHLNQIDKELHDCFKTRKEYVEVKYLHGYSTVLWTNNARKALSARQSRLVALNTAHEVIDEILDWMLDGWYFGERESNSSVTGYVPSIKKDGMLRPGQDQVLAAPAALEKVKARLEAKKKGIVTATAMRGRRSEKLAPIMLSAELKKLEKKVAKVGSDHWHMLNETESTIRFGLFMLTFMYFRAMAFLGREKRSWSGADDAVGGNSTAGSVDANISGSAIRMTDERRSMLDEEHRITNRKKKMDQIMARARVGEARKKAREENEKREAALKLQEIVRRQKLELASVGLIQRAYRGHIGRKAASRWALKRAEMNALHIIMNSAATCLQRIWRGYLARVLAVETRAEMAYFIALMRAEESAHDEEEYWKTHNAARFKKGAREFFNRK